MDGMKDSVCTLSSRSPSLVAFPFTHATEGAPPGRDGRPQASVYPLCLFACHHVPHPAHRRSQHPPTAFPRKPNWAGGTGGRKETDERNTSTCRRFLPKGNLFPPVLTTHDRDTLSQDLTRPYRPYPPFRRNGDHVKWRPRRSRSIFTPPPFSKDTPSFAFALESGR